METVKTSSGTRELIKSCLVPRSKSHTTLETTKNTQLFSRPMQHHPGGGVGSIPYENGVFSLRDEYIGILLYSSCIRMYSICHVFYTYSACIQICRIQMYSAKAKTEYMSHWRCMTLIVMLTSAPALLWWISGMTERMCLHGC